jgi:hypothetical protein
MATIGGTSGEGGVVGRPQESTLADVVTTILDKGVVIDIFARISVVGIDVLRVDARIVVASVDTYLRFAEAANRLQLGAEEPSTLKELPKDMKKSVSQGKSKGAIDAIAEKLDDIIESDEVKERA